MTDSDEVWKNCYQTAHATKRENFHTFAHHQSHDLPPARDKTTSLRFLRRKISVDLDSVNGGDGGGGGALFRFSRSILARSAIYSITVDKKMICRKCVIVWQGKRRPSAFVRPFSGRELTGRPISGMAISL